MFINPIKTGVIILGASEFPEYEEDSGLDRAVFANAANRAKEYFKNSDTGLGIPDENFFRVLEEDVDATGIINLATEFVQQGVRPGGRPSFQDIFVYIVTHGVKLPGQPFRFMVKWSREHPNGTEATHTSIEFANFFHSIHSNAHCRVYFIIDACDSAHAVDDLRRFGEFDYSGREAYSNVRRDLMPERGAVVFLSNGRANPGPVLAKDPDREKEGPELDGPCLELPLFSQVLFDCLSEGNPGFYPYGFSFQILKKLLTERMAAYVEKGVEPLDTGFDVFDFEQNEGPGLSNACIFPNNDPTKPNRNAVARDVRNAYKRAFNEEGKLRHTTSELIKQKMLNEGQANKIKRLGADLDRTQDALKTTEDALKSATVRARVLSYFSFGLAVLSLLAVPLVCLALWMINPLIVQEIVIGLLELTSQP